MKTPAELREMIKDLVEAKGDELPLTEDRANPYHYVYGMIIDVCGVSYSEANSEDVECIIAELLDDPTTTFEYLDDMINYEEDKCTCEYCLRLEEDETDEDETDEECDCESCCEPAFELTPEETILHLKAFLKDGAEKAALMSLKQYIEYKKG